MATELELIHTNLRRYTFQNKRIKEWVESNCHGMVLNLFAGRTKLDVKEIRNDLDPKANSRYKLDALDFVENWSKKHPDKKFNTVILDPPYSYRKAMEMYQGNYSSKFKRIADRLPLIITDNASVISFGYHSSFLGKTRGFDLHKLCVFAHGGAQHSTIAIVEKRKTEQ